MSRSPRHLLATIRTTRALSTLKAAQAPNLRRLLNPASIPLSPRSAMASNQQFCVPETSPDFSALLADFKSTAGKTIKCKAAVAWEAKKPLDITEIEANSHNQRQTIWETLYSSSHSAYRSRLPPRARSG